MVATLTPISLAKSRIPLLGFSNLSYNMLDEFQHADAIRTPVVSLPADHCFIVSIGVVHVMFNSLYNVHRTLSSNHDVSILMPCVNPYDTGVIWKVLEVPVV